MTLKIVWLKNQGVRVVREMKRGNLERFVRPDGHLAPSEAAAALKLNIQRIYRAIAAGKMKAINVDGDYRIPLSEVKKMKWPGRARPPRVK